MKRVLVMLAAALLLPGAARAEGKCGDAPYRMADGKVVVTWVLPVPAGTEMPEHVDDAVLRMAGPDGHPSIPAKYGKNRKAASLQVRFLAKSLAELQAWEAQYDVAPEPGPTRLLQSYFDRGYWMFGTLVEHPEVPEARRTSFTKCTCTLQRAVIAWDAGVERIWVRSWFHSAASESEFHNFHPAGGLLVKLNSPSRIWFPLAFSEVAAEPSSYPSLDILTKKPLPLAWFPRKFALERRAPLKFEGSTWQVVRVTAKLDRGQAAPDLDVPVPP